MRRTAAKRLAVAVVFTLAVRTVAARQKAETGPQGEPFKFESKINVVIVPVLVVDSHGRAIGNLKQGDFQVFDRGKRQVISHFTVQMRAGKSTETQALANAPASVPSPAPTAKVAPQRFV